MPKVRQFATMEDSHGPEGLKHTGIKRKAVKEESSDSTEEPPQNKLRRCEDTFSELPIPGRFMKLEETIEILRNPKKVFESLPKGKKNNVFFVVEDSKNAVRRENNLPVKYNDGCKALNNKGNHGTFYVQYIEGKLTRLVFKDNLFCVPAYTNHKSVLTPLKPQPDQKDLIKVCRYYTVLMGKIKRRATAVSGGNFKDRTLFEYCGLASEKNKCSNTSILGTDTELPQGKHTSILETDTELPQGKLKVCDGASCEGYDIKRQQTAHKRYTKAKKKYKSLTPKTHKKDNDDSMPAGETHEEIKENDQQEVPRNIKQNPNTTVMMPREVSSKVHSEDLVMIAMLEENPSVQAVINRKNKPPCVILYDDKQFSDMKRNLECGSVIGIDCTHKLGDCYATITVYQNSRALHKETYEPLLYLGPVFLHWDDEFLTYMSFFSHIMDKLEDTEPVFEVKLGNDLQLPLFRALKHSFPTSVQMVNSHYLKDLVNKHLFTITDGKLKTRSIILQKIFGSKGLVSSPSLSALQNSVLDLECSFNVEEFPSLKTYFDKLQLFLYPYICEPQQKGISQKLWANGNDEALNELLGTFLKRKHYRLPDVVEKFCTITRLQMLKLDSE